jgi:hypothetical protein
MYSANYILRIKKAGNWSASENGAAAALPPAKASLGSSILEFILEFESFAIQQAMYKLLHHLGLFVTSNTPTSLRIHADNLKGPEKCGLEEEEFELIGQKKSGYVEQHDSEWVTLKCANKSTARQVYALLTAKDSVVVQSDNIYFNCNETQFTICLQTAVQLTETLQRKCSHTSSVMTKEGFIHDEGTCNSCGAQVRTRFFHDTPELLKSDSIFHQMHWQPVVHCSPPLSLSSLSSANARFSRSSAVSLPPMPVRPPTLAYPPMPARSAQTSAGSCRITVYYVPYGDRQVSLCLTAVQDAASTICHNLTQALVFLGFKVGRYPGQDRQLHILPQEQAGQPGVTWIEEQRTYAIECGSVRAAQKLIAWLGWEDFISQPGMTHILFDRIGKPWGRNDPVPTLKVTCNLQALHDFLMQTPPSSPREILGEDEPGLFEPPAPGRWQKFVNYYNRDQD